MTNFLGSHKNASSLEEFTTTSKTYTKAGQTISISLRQLWIDLKNNANPQRFSICETVAKIERCSKIERANRRNFTKLNPNATSQQSDERTHIDINNDLIDLEDAQPLRRRVGRNKAKKWVCWLQDLALLIMLEANLIDMSKYKKQRRG
uniref:Uncharacterized protein n=1 Tax=Lactuca sativa TaxID=4236 RepID=A0A9R1X6Q0_LACSA|nr:hypothetical protein LSAT_V11C500277340 [Lactuca sativa]